MRLMTNDDLKELAGIHENLIQEQAVIKMHALNVKELAEKLEAIISKEAERVGFEPPPNEWTPVVGSESQEVSNGRTSTSVVYRGVQAAGR